MGSAREGSNPFPSAFILSALSIAMADFEAAAAELNIKNIVITMILSAFGFLVALAWRDAIQQTIDLLVPAGEGLTYTWVAAITVTIIAVLITFVLIKLRNADLIPDRYEEKVKNKVRKKKSTKRR